MNRTTLHVSSLHLTEDAFADLQLRIARRADELSQQAAARGSRSDLDHWLQAEREVFQDLGARAPGAAVPRAAGS